jgi:hypothetical protein
MKDSKDYVARVRRLVEDVPLTRSIPLTIFVDGRGRRLRISRYGLNDFDPLVEMYRTLDEHCNSQGLPPRDEQRLRVWLTRLATEGFNLIAKDRARGGPRQSDEG